MAIKINDPILMIKKFEEQGFVAQRCNISFAAVSIICFALALFVRIVLNKLSLLDKYPSFPVIIIILIATPIAHEILHAVGFIARGNAKWGGDIKFGFSIKLMSAWCRCSIPVPFADFFIGAICPFIIISVGLFVFSIIIGSNTIMFISIFNFLLSTGDLALSVLLLIRHPDVVFDDSSGLGFTALYKKRDDRGKR